MGAVASRVLIADSDLSLRQQLFSALLDQDIFSDCVGTTTEALGKLGEEKYGVVLLDLAMPFGDIDAVIARIAILPLTQRPVVLVLAANPIAARSLDVEIVQIVLRRPVYLSQLVDVVRNCIRSTVMRRHVEVPEKPSGSGDHAMS
jgi:DNA-binding response OmpR family regulator